MITSSVEKIFEDSKEDCEFEASFRPPESSRHFSITGNIFTTRNSLIRFAVNLETKESMSKFFPCWQ